MAKSSSFALLLDAHRILESAVRAGHGHHTQQRARLSLFRERVLQLLRREWSNIDDLICRSQGFNLRYVAMSRVRPDTITAVRTGSMSEAVCQDCISPSWGCVHGRL